MERFQGTPRGMDGVLKAANGFVVVGPRRVECRRGRSLTGALWKVLGVVERVIVFAVLLLFHVARFEGCGWYERCGGVGRCGRDECSERDMAGTAEGPCVECGKDEPRHGHKI